MLKKQKQRNEKRRIEKQRTEKRRNEKRRIEKRRIEKKRNEKQKFTINEMSSENYPASVFYENPFLNSNKLNKMPPEDINVDIEHHSILHRIMLIRQVLKYCTKQSALSATFELTNYIFPYIKDDPLRNKHKYPRSYVTNDLYYLDDECISFENHDRFIKILLIQRFLEKYTRRADLAATLELTHYIFAFSDNPIIIITASSHNFTIISDGSYGLRYVT